MIFPADFLWGVSNSGFQFEMGDPSGENIDPNTDWYVWLHDPSNIKKGIVSGDLPEKGVNYEGIYRQDHTIAKKLGLTPIGRGLNGAEFSAPARLMFELGLKRRQMGTLPR